ncbi:WRKY transcription factor 51 [Populus alba x Populus x berolinensis]|nr:WRKY transcription factor 51 [Populus alba x Populus x berolinensis]
MEVSINRYGADTSAILSVLYNLNYYKCSSSGCNVKKRVERDREDSRYVLTSYDGVHNHESPCMVYYNNQIQMPLMSSNAWTLQPSTLHSSSFS